MGKIPVPHSCPQMCVCERERDRDTDTERERRQSIKETEKERNCTAGNEAEQKQTGGCISQQEKGTSYKNSKSRDKGPGSRGPQTFWHQGPISWKTIFPQMKGDGFGMTQAHYMSHALYFYYCYINFTSYHQALDHGGGGALPGNTTVHVL